VHKVLAANKNAKPLGTDRRDEMRSALRAKISQRDYVDKDMKHFHYGKKGVSNGVVTQNGVLAQQEVAGGNVATQIAAAQHLLYLQQKHAQEVEEQQMAELNALKAEQHRILAEHNARYE